MTMREATGPEDLQNWDLDNPVKSGPVKNRRTVVSVSFPSSALQVVAGAAGEAGVSTSQFIREAAIAKASPTYADIVISWAGASAPVVTHLSPSCTTLAQSTHEPSVERTSEGALLYTPA